MDSSIRHEIVEGVLNDTPELPTAAESLSPAERVCIFREVVKRSKPQFKYIPAFEPIREEMRKMTHNPGSLGSRRTDKSVMQFPHNFDEKTRCVRFLYLSCGLTHEDLLLADDGRCIKWVHEYDSDSHQVGAYDWSDNETATKSHFHIVDDDELGEILTPERFVSCLGTLRAIVTCCIAEKEKRLESMRALGLFLTQISGNVYSREVADRKREEAVREWDKEQQRIRAKK